MKRNVSSGLKWLVVALTTAWVVWCSTPKATIVQHDTQNELAEQLHFAVSLEQDMRLVNTFDPNKHVKWNLLITLPATIMSAQLQEQVDL